MSPRLAPLSFEESAPEVMAFFRVSAVTRQVQRDRWGPIPALPLVPSPSCSNAGGWAPIAPFKRHMPIPKTIQRLLLKRTGMEFPEGSGMKADSSCCRVPCTVWCGTLPMCGEGITLQVAASACINTHTLGFTDLHSAFTPWKDAHSIVLATCIDCCNWVKIKRWFWSFQVLWSWNCMWAPVSSQQRHYLQVSTSQLQAGTWELP